MAMNGSDTTGNEAAAPPTAARTERRRRVAALVRELYDSRLSQSDFFHSVAALDGITEHDPEMRELLQLLQGEPANTWLFGVSGEATRQHSRRIRELVELFSR